MGGMNRRHLLKLAGTIPFLACAGESARGAERGPVRPPRLSVGDTVALVAPASATFLRMELEIARESLEALGLKVVVGEHLSDRHGYLAGADRARAADINRFFADRSIRAVLPIRGGWGSSRLLPSLDYEAIGRNPKIVLGYSDITALLLAITAKTGLVTFHSHPSAGRAELAWGDDRPPHAAVHAAGGRGGRDRRGARDDQDARAGRFPEYSSICAVRSCG